MRQSIYLIVFLFSVQCWYADLYAQNEQVRPAVIRIDNPAKAEEPATPIIVADGFSYYTTQNGIYLIFPKTNNNVKLMALTGQLIWSGELVSGRFYIPTGRGIYFLRVNNKSYKVSCK
ncbi:MAG: hypothetical protein LWW91_10375 [Bacteroidales bacterium]|jgi:hypothetical protein|nr:MAG: hypothetical protein F9K10_00820 [Paludibacter sp.]MCE1156510.1 hypothetical protein [Bacteroidales bacterium]OJX90729.1 MAG: hypothetical protein BGP01_04980 [Paludibacter sp. 47-17]